VLKCVCMIQKIFITRSGKANITCAQCGKVSGTDVSKFKHTDKAVNLKVTCACGHKFSVILERRLHIRKGVDLKGTLTFKDKKYGMKIFDISRMGLKLRTEIILAIQEGERLVIDFILDDFGKSRVEKEVIVKKTNGTDIGVEFTSHNHYDKFGPYILFHFP